VNRLHARSSMQFRRVAERGLWLHVCWLHLHSGCFRAVVYEWQSRSGEGYNNVISRNDPTSCVACQVAYRERRSATTCSITAFFDMLLLLILCSSARCLSGDLSMTFSGQVVTIPVVILQAR